MNKNQKIKIGVASLVIAGFATFQPYSAQAACTTEPGMKICRDTVAIIKGEEYVIKACVDPIPDETGESCKG